MFRKIIKEIEQNLSINSFSILAISDISDSKGDTVKQVLQRRDRETGVAKRTQSEPLRKLYC